MVNGSEEMKKGLIIMSSVFVLGSCSSVEADDSRFDNSSLYISSDNETGCKYLIYEGYKLGGITPLLKSDGTPDCGKNN
ncbi:hypothetical protein CHH83_01970 [Bacillus sp. 7586-K]|nr:hypothetical protein CHH83_01970 [Bacillus sp. 7586-K]